MTRFPSTDKYNNSKQIVGYRGHQGTFSRQSSVSSNISKKRGFITDDGWRESVLETLSGCHIFNIYLPS